MQLTYHTDYALRVFIFLMARPHETVSTRAIAEHFAISLNHLIKVTKRMTQLGWLESTRGSGGGVRLSEDALQLRLGDVIRTTENLTLVECFDLSINTCPIHRGCQLKMVLYHAQKAFLDVLNQFTVRDLALSPAEIKQLLRAFPKSADKE